MIHHSADAAAWLPSRFKLATLRVFAFLMLRRRGALPPSRGPRRVMLTLDREQSSFEAYLLTGAFLGLTLATLSQMIGIQTIVFRVVAILGVIAALSTIIPMAGAVVVRLMRAVGLAKRWSSLQIQEGLLHLGMVAMALLLVRQSSPARWLGFAWLTLVAVNGFFAILAHRLSETMNRVEREIGGKVSEMPF